MAAVADAMAGLLDALVKEEGPVQAYVAPLTAGVVRLIAEPSQFGELAVTAGVAGIGFTVIVIGADVNVAGLAQDDEDVRIHVTDCPFVKPLVEYVAPVPTLAAPTCH